MKNLVHRQPGILYNGGYDTLYLCENCNTLSSWKSGFSNMKPCIYCGKKTVRKYGTGTWVNETPWYEFLLGKVKGHWKIGEIYGRNSGV